MMGADGNAIEAVGAAGACAHNAYGWIGWVFPTGEALRWSSTPNVAGAGGIYSLRGMGVVFAGEVTDEQ